MSEPQLTQEQLAQRHLEDLQAMMSTKRGRRFMWEFLSRCGVFQMSYTKGDTHETAFREGMRSIGNRYLVELNTSCNDLYETMQKENRIHER